MAAAPFLLLVFRNSKIAGRSVLSMCVRPTLCLERSFQMVRFLTIVLAVVISFQPVLAGEPSSAEAQLAKIKAEYSDVLALSGIPKKELLAIAHLLRTRPEMAIDQTAT